MALFSSAGIAAALSTAAGFFTAATAFVLNTAVGLGVSLIGQALSGKSSAANQNFAINGTIQGGGDLPRSFIFGRYATAGSLVWVNTWGNDGDTPNAFLTQVIALSDLPIQGLAELWVNGENVPFGGAGAYGTNVGGEYADNLWFRFYDGTQTSADGFLFNSASNNNRWWNPDRIGRGVAYVVVTARVSRNKFSGVPSFKFVVNGSRLYDPSRDSTAGGAGGQRWADPSTWGGDGDHLPAVQLYNLLRGITYNGGWFYGLQGLSAARVPADNWIAQINKCRVTIAGASGLEPFYRSAGEIQVDAPLASAVEAILTACQGKISEVGGVYRLHCGAPDSAVIAFTDGDILSTEEQEFTPFLGLADTINGVSATYPSAADGWVTKTAPPLYRPDFEAQDGNRRLMADVSLDFVPYAEQVQRLMRSALEEARRFRRHTLVLPAEFWAYATPGTTFSWTSERNGYVNKLMRLDGVADRANLDVMIDITEVDPNDYDWDSGADFQPPVDGAVGVIRPSPQAIVDWFAEPATIKDSVGDDRRPAIRLIWDNSDGRLDDVIGIEYEVRMPITLEKVTEGRTDQPQAGSMLISQGLLPNQTYLVRGEYIPDNPRAVLWSAFIAVTTPNVLLSDKDVFVDIDLTGIGDALAWVRNVARTADDAIDQLIASQLEMASVAFTDKQTLRREMSVSLGAARAEYREEITLAVNETMAVAGKVENLTASLGGNSAAINIAWAAVAAATGYAASYKLQAAVNDGEFRAATFGLDVPANPALPSRITMEADQLVLSNGATYKRPFVMEDGILYLDDVRVNTLSALSSVLGNVDISNAYIGNLIVGTSNIEQGAVTRYAFNQNNSPVNALNSNFVTVVQISIEHGVGSPPVEVLASSRYAVNADTSLMAFRVISTTDGTILQSVTNFAAMANSPSRPPITTVAVHFPPAGRLTTTYELQIASLTGSGSAGANNSYIRAFAMRR